MVEPDTGLTTVCALTKTNGPANSDATVGAELVTADSTLATDQQVEVLGDSAYATGDMLHTLDGKKWLPLLKPWPLRPTVEGGFTLDDFRYDADALTFQAHYRQHRPMVERSIAWLTRGARRVPYRGVEKNNNWLHHRVAALNLRRLLAMGLTMIDGAWALA